MAVVVPKHGHTIVERNRLRRRLRELARTRIIPGMRSVDIIIRTLSSAYVMSFQQLAAEIDMIAQQLSGKPADSE